MRIDVFLVGLAPPMKRPLAFADRDLPPMKRHIAFADRSLPPMKRPLASADRSSPPFDAFFSFIKRKIYGNYSKMLQNNYEAANIHSILYMICFLKESFQNCRRSQTIHFCRPIESQPNRKMTDTPFMRSWSLIITQHSWSIPMRLGGCSFLLGSAETSGMVFVISSHGTTT